jgi:hypothetical protein
MIIKASLEGKDARFSSFLSRKRNIAFQRNLLNEKQLPVAFSYEFKNEFAHRVSFPIGRVETTGEVLKACHERSSGSGTIIHAG